MRTIRRLLPFIFSIMLLSSCSAPSGSANSYRQISMNEAVEMMKKESGYIILDARRPDEYAEGHIPGAINIPNEEIGTAEIAELPDKSQLILVYCRSGRRSKEASEKLVKLGYTNVVEFGGILDWKGEIEK
ncbi:MAG: rhodanese-like domain-containing protein [Ruminococcaceae bacterium]|nr:rhodanese-like domain-containing protein [Oscillospiraceae bacterium]